MLTRAVSGEGRMDAPPFFVDSAKTAGQFSAAVLGFGQLLTHFLKTSQVTSGHVSGQVKWTKLQKKFEIVSPPQWLS